MRAERECRLFVFQKSTFFGFHMLGAIAAASTASCNIDLYGFGI
jgi:hypothetical protein